MMNFLLKENQCDQVYEKKCHIEMLEIDVNQTVTTCKRPLKRICPNKGSLEEKFLAFIEVLIFSCGFSEERHFAGASQAFGRNSDRNIEHKQ